MRILLLGNTGQLGWESERCLAPLGELVAVDYPLVDFTKPDQLVAQVTAIKPDVIVNCVAYTAVDKAEEQVELAQLINARAVGILAETALKLGSALLHFSTDYVFDGKKGAPYVETDQPGPLNAYGKTKWQGELVIQEVDCAHLILRTSWVYSLRRDSFVTKVLQWSKDKSSIRVVADQVSNPTWARMLAQITSQVIARGGNDIIGWIKERRGLYHLAGSGCASRMEWAQEVINLAGKRQDHPVELIPAVTSEFPSPAERPLFSALDCSLFSRTFDLSLPNWKTALRLAMDDPTKSNN